MRYMGGKSRISKALSEVILAHTDRRGVYVEPFVGGGAMAEKMAPHFETVVLNDLHEDLMLMWDAVLNKGWVPPTEVSYEQYQELRYTKEPSALRGFVGFGCSFGGRWFEGYARGGFQSNGKPRNHQTESQRNLMKQVKKIGSVVCTQGSYEDLPPVAGTPVIYCDPPYEGTKGYKGGAFPHEEFWAKAQEWAEAGADVFVSEYSAPVGWEPIWEKPLRSSVRVGSEDRHTAVEKLFVFGGTK